MDPNASVPIPQRQFPKFGDTSFTDEEEAEIQRQLEQTIGVEDVLFREGPANSATISDFLQRNPMIHYE